MIGFTGRFDAEHNYILQYTVTHTLYPCGGGVEYLLRDPASRKRRRNGTKNAAP
jgi:hypothetical protein